MPWRHASVSAATSRRSVFTRRLRWPYIKPKFGSATTTSTLLYADPAFNENNTAYYAPFNFNEGWHTVGLQWDPDKVTVYVDGLKLYTRTYQWVYADGTLAAPAHIMLNLAIGGSWAGRYGIDDSAFPQALQIDWVRAYKKDS